MGGRRLGWSGQGEGFGGGGGGGRLGFGRSEAEDLEGWTGVLQEKEGREALGPEHGDVYIRATWARGRGCRERKDAWVPPSLRSKPPSLPPFPNPSLPPHASNTTET